MSDKQSRSGRTVVRPKRQYAAARSASPQNRKRRIKPHFALGITLILVSAALAGSHLATHAGAFDPLPGNMEDLFLGFPAAGISGIAGFVALIWSA